MAVGLKVALQHQAGHLGDAGDRGFDACQMRHSAGVDWPLTMRAAVGVEEALGGSMAAQRVEVFGREAHRVELRAVTPKTRRTRSLGQPLNHLTRAQVG